MMRRVDKHSAIHHSLFAFPRLAWERILSTSKLTLQQHIHGPGTAISLAG
jgi:hypothetical protein